MSSSSSLIPLAHGCLIYDNSGLEPDLLLSISGRAIDENHLDPASAGHVRIARAAAGALVLDIATVLETATKP